MQDYCTCMGLENYSNLMDYSTLWLLLYLQGAGRVPANQRAGDGSDTSHLPASNQQSTDAQTLKKYIDRF